MPAEGADAERFGRVMAAGEVEDAVLPCLVGRALGDLARDVDPKNKENLTRSVKQSSKS